MKTMHVAALSGVLVILSGVSVAQDKPVQKAPATGGLPPKEALFTEANAKAPSDFPVIGYLEKRDRTIAIKAGPKGPVYSVKTAAGKVLCENVSLDQLRAQAPELHQFIKSAVAGNTGRNGVVVDASLRPISIR